MKTLTFLLQAFGFANIQDLGKSTFGFISGKVLFINGVLGFLISLFNSIPFVFGVEQSFFLAYVGLVIFEWVTGVGASLNRGEKHESRKLGRMLLKVLIYSLLIALLHQMTHINIPESVAWLEAINPFKWLYWVMVSIIIWQLWVSVLENLDCLGFRFAKMALKVINQKFEKNLQIQDDEKTNSNNT